MDVREARIKRHLVHVEPGILDGTATFIWCECGVQFAVKRPEKGLLEFGIFMTEHINAVERIRTDKWT